MRLMSGGLLGAGALGLSMLLAWGWSLSMSATGAEAQRWQHRELVFLKAAYDRIREDFARQPRGPASLQAEQDRIVRRMADTAKLMPKDTVPVQVRALLAAAGPASPPVAATTAGQEGPALRIGLGNRSPPGIDVSGFALGWDLRQPLVLHAVRRKAPAAAARKTPEAASR